MVVVDAKCDCGSITMVGGMGVCSPAAPCWEIAEPVVIYPKTCWPLGVIIPGGKLWKCSLEIGCCSLIEIGCCSVMAGWFKVTVGCVC